MKLNLMSPPPSGPMDELFELEEELIEHLPLKQKNKGRLLMFLDLVINVLIIVVLVFVTRTFLISPFQVFGPSMCNTLNYIDEQCHHGFGEYIIVNKAVYQTFFGLFDGAPERGDVIVFKPPENAKDFFIKRIVGLPRDTVEIQRDTIVIYNKENPDGVLLDESYLTEQNRQATSMFQSESTKKFVVPEGRYFVMGDNRSESTDSRTCFLPPARTCTGDKHFLERDRIEGRAWVVLWPFGNTRLLRNPDYGALEQ